METKLSPSTSGGATSPVETRTIAKEAYIYGFPMVDNCRIQYAYFGQCLRVIGHQKTVIRLFIAV